MAKITPNQLFNTLTSYSFPQAEIFLSPYLAELPAVVDDMEEEVEDVLNYIINSNTEIYLVDSSTGEILHTINLQNFGGEEIPADISSDSEIQGNWVENPDLMFANHAYKTAQARKIGGML